MPADGFLLAGGDDYLLRVIVESLEAKQKLYRDLEAIVGADGRRRGDRRHGIDGRNGSDRRHAGDGRNRSNRCDSRHRCGSVLCVNGEADGREAEHGQDGFPAEGVRRRTDQTLYACHEISSMCRGGKG